MTELPTAPESELVSTFFVRYKLDGKTHMKRKNGTQSDADNFRLALAETPGVTDIKIEWER